MRPWDYLFVDQPAGCITMGNSVTMNVSLYVRGNLCLTNNSQISSPAVAPSRKPLRREQRADRRLRQPDRRVRCDWLAATTRGSPLPCGPATPRLRRARSARTRRSIAKPTADLPYWYTNAQLGPQSACSTGSFPGGFDNDTTLNVSRGEIDLTPAPRTTVASSMRSGNDVAQLKWEPGSPGTLTIKGVIYFDAHLSWSNLNLIQYDGKAVIYGSGQVRIKNRADICGVPACDATWDPRVDLLVFVAGSLVSQVATTPIGGDIGNHVNFQGALYIVNDFDMDNNTTVWGPVITRSTTINNSALVNAPPFPIEWMYGMPGATQTVTDVQLVQGSYAG